MTSPGRYQFHELIATGGMGEVWRATDTVLRRDVAVKLLKPEYADDEVSRSRFESEGRHAAALHHPHICAVYDVGEMPTASGLMRPYLVMELVDGKPLSELIAGGDGLDPEVVRDLLGQAGDALAAAHRAGIVHRDVKPANLLVTPDKQVKVTDFGIARAASSSSITSTGQVMGTPQYLSPEQARGEMATPASDVYSLGIVAWESLVGHRPFQKDTPVATAIAHLHDPVPPLPGSVPPDLAAVVMRALEKDPAKRYPDAAAFTAALRGLDTQRTDTPAAGIPLGLAGGAALGALAGAGGAAAADETRAIPSTTVVSRPPAAATPAAVAAEPERGRRRWWQLGVLNWVLIVLLLLVVIAIGLLAWFLSHGSSASPAAGQPSTPAAHHSAHAKKAAKAFNLPASCYAGSTVDTAAADLRQQGLMSREHAVPPQPGHAADTVQYVTPCRDVRKGEVVVIKYFQAAATSAPPAPASPTPSHTSSAPASPTSTVTVTPSPTSSPTISPSGTSTAGSAGDNQQ